MEEKTSMFGMWKKQKSFAKSEWNRKYSRYYLIYIAIGGTGLLSIATGLLLPFNQPNINGVNAFVAFLAGLYFAVGFVSNGEVAAMFWFNKLTDHDPDSTPQQWIAGVSLVVSIIVSLVTALSASLLIAFWLGIFPAFSGVPDWAQVWIVDIIPIMWIYHVCAGVAFRAMSEEAQMERMAKAFLREKQNELDEARQEARVNWLKENARRMYEEQGEAEAREDIEQRFPNRARKPQQQPRQMPSVLNQSLREFGAEADTVKENPTDRQRQQ